MQISGKDNDQAGTINSEIVYSIISQEPESPAPMFTIDRNTGKLYVNSPLLDRETNDFYQLIVQGADLAGAPGALVGTGTVEIRVQDINDNIPTLEKQEYSGYVDENVQDVVVMRIKSLDRDLEFTDNWKTVFNIASGNEDNLFHIYTEEETNEGVLMLIKPVDFEEVQKLELSLLILNVAPFVEGGATLMDVDVLAGAGNRPSGPRDPLGPGPGSGAVVGSGAETVSGAAVGSGSDPLSGAGGIASPDAGVKEAEAGPKAPTKGYLIKIAVNNMPEDPVFLPETKNLRLSEDPAEAPENGVIAVFAAEDPDTGKPAEDVSYLKGYDPGNWFTVDKETAEIRLNKAPDRESPFLVNGTYIAKILAITKDEPPKTATGTLAIQVSDANDHCPTLSATRASVCSNQKTVYVTGVDQDASPNAAPFTFTIIPEGTRGKWEIEVINETSAAIHSQNALWPGSYEVRVEVADAQGLSCPDVQTFTVEVCTCVDGEDCGARTAKLGWRPTSELSAAAVGLMLLALGLLLFVPLLMLFCQRGGQGAVFPDQFDDLPFNTKEQLVSYHTEGIGEDKEVPLLSVPIMLENQRLVETNTSGVLTGVHQATSAYNESLYNLQKVSRGFSEVDNIFRVGLGAGCVFRRQHEEFVFDDLALPVSILQDYYSQKAECAVPVQDSPLVFKNEGSESPISSVGCCSLLESEKDLQFLDDLGPKFKTLAEICSPLPPSPKLSIKASNSIPHQGVPTALEMKCDTNTEKDATSTEKFSFRSRNGSNKQKKAQNTVLQQEQSLYFTTSPVLQPMHYVVQPQMQNTVLLADGFPADSFQGLYVVNGLESPTSGLLVTEIQNPVVSGSQSPTAGLIVANVQNPPSIIPTSGLVVTEVQRPPSGHVIKKVQNRGTGTKVKRPSSVNVVNGLENPTSRVLVTEIPNPVVNGSQSPTTGFIVANIQNPPSITPTSGLVVTEVQRPPSGLVIREVQNRGIETKVKRPSSVKGSKNRLPGLSSHGSLKLFH
nr:desmoglein-2.1-like [Nerophis lumbriciformis]